MKNISLLLLFVMTCILGSIVAFTVTADKKSKRDFSKFETFLSIPKVCIGEILAFNFHSDCISIVDTKNNSGNKQRAQYWNFGWFFQLEVSTDIAHDKREACYRTFFLKHDHGDFSLNDFSWL